MPEFQPDPRPESGVRNEISGTGTGAVVQAGAIAGGLHLYPSVPARVVPRQLPAPPQLFTGRANELAALTDMLGRTADDGPTVVISAIGGMGGIGKTWLAVYWAHQNIGRFPDGQLYVNLRGFDPNANPLPAEVAMQGFLYALGTDPAAIPAALEAQAGLYRSLAAGRRMLIVLDNARDTAQVESLLPGSATCTVLVTSRFRLAGLVTGHSARMLDLDILTESEARELLARQLSTSRLAVEPDAVAELLRCCGGLPLALGIVSARIQSHPRFSLAELAEELRESSVRLDALDAGDLNANLRAVLSWSYHALSSKTAEVFGLLGLAPGPDISRLAAASLTGLPIRQTHSLLRELESTYLIQQHRPGRYRMHDLIRLYAGQQADHDCPPEMRTAALQRLVDFYLHTAHSADRLLEPHRTPMEIGEPASGCHPQPLTNATESLEWFDIEYPCLLAAQRAVTAQHHAAAVWQLAWALDTFYVRRGHRHDRIAMWRAALAAAERLGDPDIRSRAHRHLGGACAQGELREEALRHLQQALALAEHTGGIARTHYDLAHTWAQQGDDQRALTHATQALHLYQNLGNPMWEAAALNTVGWLHARRGHHERARAQCETALTVHRQHRDQTGEAAALDSLGYIAHQTRRYTEALDYYHQSLAIYRSGGNTYQEANTLDRLGEIHTALGHHTQAQHTWQQALNIYNAQHRTTEAARLQLRLNTRPIAPT